MLSEPDGGDNYEDVQIGKNSSEEEASYEMLALEERFYDRHEDSYEDVELK